MQKLSNIPTEDLRIELQRRGFFTRNLWKVCDVQDLYKVDEETAQRILYDSLTNEYIMDIMFDTIHEVAEDTYNAERV